MKKILLLIHIFISSLIYSQNIDTLINQLNSKKNFKIKFKVMYSYNRENRSNKNLFINWTARFKHLNYEKFKGDTILTLVKVKYFNYELFMDSIDNIGGNGYKICEDSIRNQIISSYNLKDDIIYLIQEKEKFYLKYDKLIFMIKLKSSFKDKKKSDSKNIKGEIISLIRDGICSFIIVENFINFKYYVWAS